MGTSIEVLAPYLPYGITVASQWADGSVNTSGLLTGLDAWRARWENGEEDYRSAFASILPVLKPFSDLVKPLPDGTVPAVELMKFVLSDDIEFNKEKSSACLDKDDDYDDETIYVSIVDTYGERHNVTLYGWDYSCDTACAVPDKYIGYLRRHHFAVGLQPDQYVTK